MNSTISGKTARFSLTIDWPYMQIFYYYISLAKGIRMIETKMMK